tara:strand:+ start:36049 stop:36909 length:861 start_codon:yes stop_codon:yes gene_type:complete
MYTLIADSGSTKTEWVLIRDNRETETYFTEGLNPNFMSYQELVEVIDDGLVVNFENNLVGEVYFYGAGCGTEKNIKKLKEVLTSSFEKAEVHVDSDLLAAAIACFGNEAGVACILGTGSNTCIYNGEKIVNQIPSLGFTLGDEGSGGYFGKRIIHSYFYNEMPEDLRKELSNRYDMSLSHILDKVYQQPNANRFVASFSKLLAEYKDHPYIQRIVREGFSDFVEKQLGYFGNLSGQKIGFVGSIAAIHREILTQVLVEKGLKAEIIIQKPIDRLVEAHKLKADNLI